MKVTAVNFGCKVSQSDAVEALRALMASGNFQLAPSTDKADLILVYCCCVTGRGAQKVRQRVRKLIKEVPSARIMLCGCYPKAYSSELASIPGGSGIIPGHNPGTLMQHLGIDEEDDHWIEDSSNTLRLPPGSQGNHHGLRMRSRALIKIQDGCPGSCTYCIVRHIRGAPSSMAPEDVVQRVRHVVDSGFQELVLVGVNLAAYGFDLTPRLTLAGLLQRITELPGDFRIRLSSLEPRWIGRELVEIIAGSDKVCSHFHIPLQSGDDTVLARMGRGYTAEEYTTLISMISTTIDAPGIGTDIMVGFCSESSQAFDNTRSLVETLPFTYLHVFRYSPRPGTPAANERDDILPSLKKERSALLREIDIKKRQQAACAMVGTSRQAVVIHGTENHSSLNDVRYLLLTDNYFKCQATQTAQSQLPATGSLVTVRLDSVDDVNLIGHIQD